MDNRNTVFFYVLFLQIDGKFYIHNNAGNIQGYVNNMWRYLVLFMLFFLGGCSSTTQLLRPAPKEGIAVNGINILFTIIPPDTVITSGTKTPTITQKVGSGYTTKLRPQTERLGNEIGERFAPQFKGAGIVSNFATLQVLPGVAPTPLKDLFPANSTEMHTLIITPVHEKEVCAPTCQTTFTISLSLRAPKDNKELWNLRMQQSIAAGADWIPIRNYQLIDDMAKSVLAVTVRK